MGSGRPAAIGRGRFRRFPGVSGLLTGSALVLAAACTTLVAPDESRLQPPPDTGPVWCEDPVGEITVLFPRPNSGVLGIVPIWVDVEDCSGIERAWIEFYEGASGDRVIREEPLVASGARFVAFWDTATWSGGAPTIVAVARPVRPTVPDLRSPRVTLRVFRFEPPMSATGDTSPGGWSFVDFDDDGDPDLIWGGSIFRNEGRWPYVDVTVGAFEAFCSVVPNACADGRPVVAGGWAWPSPTVADLTGDGILDVVVSGESPAIPPTLIEGELGDVAGSRFWRAKASRVLLDDWRAGPVATLAADFNLDGWLDLLVTQTCQHTASIGCTVPVSAVLLMGGNGETWPPLHSVNATGLEDSWWDHGATAGDFLGDDGYPDVVVTRMLGAPSRAYRNRGAEAGRRFERAPGDPAMPSTSPAQLVDYDRDGDLDVAFPRPHMYVESALWRNDGGILVDVTGVTGYPGGFLVDVNNDAYPDAGAVLGTPDGSFVQTGINALGIPFDVGWLGVPTANPAIDFVRGLEDVSQSTLSATGRIAVSVRVPFVLPYNRYGIGTRIELVPIGDDFDHPTTEGGRRTVAEIAQFSSGTALGFHVQFGVDTAPEGYRIRFRLPTPDLRTAICGDSGIIPSNSVVVLRDHGGELTCDVRR
ncbi:MAG: VCBS repeat-containing protein [Myxococcota bacterium]|nr:VCBS repeat-containing protein [Myxococcota bacterium]